MSYKWDWDKPTGHGVDCWGNEFRIYKGNGLMIWLYITEETEEGKRWSVANVYVDRYHLQNCFRSRCQNLEGYKIVISESDYSPSVVGMLVGLGCEVTYYPKGIKAILKTE